MAENLSTNSDTRSE